MADPVLRRARLLDLLPRIYGTQPANSAVGAVVELMAQGLGRLDEDMRRVMHDRWVGLATGAAPAGEESALEKLGNLLQIPRLPPRIRHLRHEFRDSDVLAVFFESAQQCQEAAALIDLKRHGDVILSSLLPKLEFSISQSGTEMSVKLAGAGGAENLASPFAAFMPHLGLVLGGAASARQCKFQWDARLAVTSLSVAFDSSSECQDAMDHLANAAPNEATPGILANRYHGLGFVLTEAGKALQVTPMTGSPRLAGATVSPFAALVSLLEAEAPETYRQRLQITAAVLNRGLNTPRALLSLAIADLGAEPCPRMERKLDATVARGMPIGMHKRCPACADPALPCPNGDKAVLEAWITEQPAVAAIHRDPGASLRQTFSIPNDSLLADRPVLQLSAVLPISYPAVQSRTTGEIVLYAGNLHPGDVLTLYPRMEAGETQAFDGYESQGHHDWLRRSPGGRAEVLDGHKKELRDVSDAVFYLWGSRFNDKAEGFGGGDGAGLRCGVLEQAVRTPWLNPGNNDWMLLTFARPASAFDDETSVFAGPNDKDGTRFALLDRNVAYSDGKFAAMLFQCLSLSDTERHGGSAEGAPPLVLEVNWLTRPPFSFRLRVPKNGWVSSAELRGAVDLLRTDLEWARPAGVRAVLDFPEPVQRDVHDSSEALCGLAVTSRWNETLEASDALPGLSVAARWPEIHESADDLRGVSVTSQWHDTHDSGEGVPALALAGRSGEDAGPDDQENRNLSMSLPLVMADRLDPGEGQFALGGVFNLTPLDWSALQAVKTGGAASPDPKKPS